MRGYNGDTMSLSNAVNFLRSESGALLLEDTLAWARWYNDHDWYKPNGTIRCEVKNDDIEFHFLFLFKTIPEYRSLFDYRTKGIQNLHGIEPTLRRATDLHINVPVIGPRLRIQHGHGTYILAREVGADFFINHQVTIGSHRGIPKIGDRVTVRTGAVLVGPISIGNDVLVTANAVVSRDIPSNHVVYAPQSVVIPRGGPLGRCNG
jgi:serine O-acetyltransferase